MINNVVLMGRICHKPELKNTQSGVEVLSFTIAVERKFSKKGEERETDFIDCQAWRQTAVFISTYFDKGSMIVVNGVRIDDTFICKKYSSTPGHRLMKITSIDENGNITLQGERYNGILED